MAKIRFLHGKKLNNTTPIVPGTFYLDLETNELWFDNPVDLSATQHNKIIDIETLIYSIDTEVISWDPELLGEESDNNSGNTSAVIGVAILGQAILGTE